MEVEVEVELVLDFLRRGGLTSGFMLGDDEEI